MKTNSLKYSVINDITLLPSMIFGNVEKLLNIKIPLNCFSYDKQKGFLSCSGDYYLKDNLCIKYPQNCFKSKKDISIINKIENILMSYLRRRYSIKFIHLLLIILEFEEKNRPDFISLEQIISSSFKKVV